MNGPDSHSDDFKPFAVSLLWIHLCCSIDRRFDDIGHFFLLHGVFLVSLCLIHVSLHGGVPPSLRTYSTSDRGSPAMWGCGRTFPRSATIWRSAPVPMLRSRRAGPASSRRRYRSGQRRPSSERRPSCRHPKRRLWRQVSGPSTRGFGEPLHRQSGIVHSPHARHSGSAFRSAMLRYGRSSPAPVRSMKWLIPARSSTFSFAAA